MSDFDPKHVRGTTGGPIGMSSGSDAAAARKSYEADGMAQLATRTQTLSALREARDAINALRNSPPLITLADRFGGYHQGERAGLEMAEDIITQIEWKEVNNDE